MYLNKHWFIFTVVLIQNIELNHCHQHHPLQHPLCGYQKIYCELVPDTHGYNNVMYMTCGVATNMDATNSDRNIPFRCNHECQGFDLNLGITFWSLIQGTLVFTCTTTLRIFYFWIIHISNISMQIHFLSSGIYVLQ